jgi:hypothetical protein
VEQQRGGGDYRGLESQPKVGSLYRESKDVRLGHLGQKDPARSDHELWGGRNHLICNAVVELFNMTRLTYSKDAIEEVQPPRTSCPATEYDSDLPPKLTQKAAARLARIQSQL